MIKTFLEYIAYHNIHSEIHMICFVCEFCIVNLEEELEPPTIKKGYCDVT